MRKVVAVVVLLPLAIAFFWFGGKGLAFALNNRAPTVIACADVRTAKPKAKWLRLTGCRLELLEAVYKGLGEEDTLYVPVVDVPGTRFVVLETQDKGYLALMGEGHRLAKGDTVGYLDWRREHASALAPVRDIEGLVRVGSKLRPKEQDGVRELGTNLDADFIVIKDRAHPTLGFPSFLVVLGLVSLVGGVVLFAKKR